jgi:hypothetical protein
MVWEPTYIPTVGDSCTGAAMYLAILAYPDDVEWRTDFVASTIALRLLHKDSLDRKTKTPRLKIPENAKLKMEKFSKTRAIQASFDRAANKLEKRYKALSVAKKVILDDFIIISNAESKPLSENTFKGKRKVSLQRNLEDYINQHARIWKPSKQVLHLAWALESHLPAKSDEHPIESLIADSRWVSKAVHDAEVIKNTTIRYIEDNTPQKYCWIRYNDMIPVLPEKSV